uniref:AP-3 complex subunit delta-like n=1 Tax=Panthera onca TaxID=9690 RepID=UPI0029555A49|nr:AP-3 complex subunit delta-like [Panthera onca]
MTSSTNNWVLIKIIKLFGALTPLEPRLGKKLIEPLTNLIHSTSAMSLLYECVNTVIAGEGPALPHRDPRGPQPAVGHMRPGPLPASGLQCRVLPPSATHLPCQQDSPSRAF